jgi:inward rectifier potassium channel
MKRTPFTYKRVQNAAELKDLGFGTQSARQRSVNSDGTFNVERRGLPIFSTQDLYTSLITMSWIKFIPLVLFVYLIINIMFASVYMYIGVEHLNGVSGTKWIDQFFDAFFFSAQTISTVGYGHISPDGFATSLVASFESLMGVLVFAVITGLLYGRFSAPKAKIVYSDNALISPYKDGKGLMFRIANKRKNQLLEVEMEVVVGLNIEENGKIMRRFYGLELERKRVNFFPLSWTIVHPITDKSPINNFSMKDLADAEAEILTLLKGFDDTYGQYVHSRKSYMFDEIIPDKKFISIIVQDDEGKTVLELDKINLYEDTPKLS